MISWGFKMKKVYAAMVNTDLTEGKGGLRTIGLFFDRDIAESAVRGQGVQGSNGTVRETYVFESLIEWAESLQDGSYEKRVAFGHLREDYRRLKLIFEGDSIIDNERE